jgi:hypothetical protein
MFIPNYTKVQMVYKYELKFICNPTKTYCLKAIYFRVLD